MKINTIFAGTVSALIIRILAMFGAVAMSGSWWVAVPAVIVLDIIEGARRREVERWRRLFR